MCGAASAAGRSGFAGWAFAGAVPVLGGCTAVAAAVAPAADADAAEVAAAADAAEVVAAVAAGPAAEAAAVAAAELVRVPGTGIGVRVVSTSAAGWVGCRSVPERVAGTPAGDSVCGSRPERPGETARPAVVVPRLPQRGRPISPELRHEPVGKSGDRSSLSR